MVSYFGELHMQIMTMLYYSGRIVLLSVELRKTSGGTNQKFWRYYDFILKRWVGI